MRGRKGGKEREEREKEGRKKKKRKEERSGERKIFKYTVTFQVPVTASTYKSWAYARRLGARSSIRASPVGGQGPKF